MYTHTRNRFFQKVTESMVESLITSMTGLEGILVLEPVRDIPQMLLKMHLLSEAFITVNTLEGFNAGMNAIMLRKV